VEASRNVRAPLILAIVNIYTAAQAPSLRTRLIIRTKYGDDFDAQLELIKSTGAGWDSMAKTWVLWLGADMARDAEALTTLFEAARSYGTFVAADLVPAGG
jgi:hypothetical protein